MICPLAVTTHLFEQKIEFQQKGDKFKDNNKKL